jgi:site-specific DNA-methyltransferase (adenine-specific)/modification methylase
MTQDKEKKVICGDCLTELKKFDDNSVDLTVTSPPYNMRTRVRNGEYTTRERSEHFSKKYKYFDDALSIDDYYKFHKSVLKELLRVSKTIFWNVSIVTGSKEAIFKIIGDFSKNIKDIIIWDKGHGQPAMHNNCINRATELIIVFENDASAGRTLNRAYFKRGEMNDIWRIKRPKEKILSHSAIFPIELSDKIIENFSKENDIILDPFMGSGTVGVSCKKLNRQFIGIELSKDYYNIAKDRIENYKVQQKLI